MSILKSRICILCPLFLSITITSCDFLGFRSGKDQPIEVQFETLTTALLFVPEAGTRIFRDSTAWAQFVGTHWRAVGSLPHFPTSAYFREHMHVGIFYGVRSGCKDEVQVIEKILQFSERIEVTVGPLPDLGECAAEETPMQIVRVPNIAMNVQFLGRVPGT